MKPIRVGPVALGEGTPAAYVTVEQNGTLKSRIDAYADYRGAFTELIVWNQRVVLGWSDVVHLIDPEMRQVRSIDCDGYFGHLYPIGDQLLVATASQLICLNIAGEIIWSRGNLGIDGVVVDRVVNGTVEGQGEWDPPGGWRKFRLALATGVPISS